MRTVFLETPQEMLDERRRLGLETLGVEFRTVDGVLHLNWDGGSAEV